MTSPNLALPLLSAAQAQKHVTVNDALSRLDGLVQLSVKDRNLTAPPASPSDGDRYIVAAGSTGAWEGWDGDVALFTGGAWVRLPPKDGWCAWVVDESLLLVRAGGTWSDLAGLLQFAQLGINTSSDQVNRLAVAADATLLSHAGADHQLKINKAAASGTASLLFQDDWSGRAEMGLAGGDDFTIKVSTDGASWSQALTIDAATGCMGLWDAVAPTAALEVAQNTTEPTIAIHNTGGVGGATFRMTDDASLGDWKFKITQDGSFKLRDQRAGADRIYISTTTGNVGISTKTPSAPLDVAGGVRVGSYTVATLPSAAALGAGTMIYVSDEAGGPVMAFSDGTDWRRMTDRAVVS